MHGARGPVLGEVVGIDARGISMSCPSAPGTAWSAGDPVESQPERRRRSARIQAGSAGWWMRWAQPLDRRGHLHEGPSRARSSAAPPSAFERRRVGARLDTGIKIFDIFTPLCRGQRMGVFAGSGVGKSTLMAMLARNTEADVIVVGLVGERGREVQDFIQADLGPEGDGAAVLVVSTGDEPPLMRRQAAWTATAVAEHFRDPG